MSKQTTNEPAKAVRSRRYDAIQPMVVLTAIWRHCTTHVRVPVEDLKPILLDHSKLWGLVKEDLG
jgi:hypothetical protein